MSKLFIDSDIILDVLARREKFYESAAEIFDLGHAKKIDLHTTAAVLANVFYILRKIIGLEKAREQLRKLRLIMKVIPVNEETVDAALSSKIVNFEDGLQFFSAKESGIPVIISKNTRDYKEKGMIIQTAEEYIKTII